MSASSSSTPIPTALANGSQGGKHEAIARLPGLPTVVVALAAVVIAAVVTLFGVLSQKEFSFDISIRHGIGAASSASRSQVLVSILPPAASSGLAGQKERVGNPRYPPKSPLVYSRVTVPASTDPGSEFKNSTSSNSGLLGQDWTDSTVPCGTCSWGTWPYEIGVVNTAGGGGVGGCNNAGPFTHFQVHQYGSPVKQLTMWADGGGLYGMIVQYFDNTKDTIGNLARGSPSSFTFGPGETLKGTAILTGNGHGDWVEYISFTTSQGRTFSAGGEHNNYYFDVDGTVLLGFHGHTSPDAIMVLGFFVSKQVTAASMTNVQYPTLSTLQDGLAPQQLETKSIVNNGSEPQTTTITYTQSTSNGQDSCWDTSSNWNFGQSITVTASVPEVGSASDSVHWSVGGSSSYEQCKSSDISKSESQSFTQTTDAYNQCDVSIVQWVSTISSVPYTATLTLTFADGTTFQQGITGVYSGTYVSTTQIQTQCHPLRSTFVRRVLPANSPVLLARTLTLAQNVGEGEGEGECTVQTFAPIRPAFERKGCQESSFNQIMEIAQERLCSEPQREGMVAIINALCIEDTGGMITFNIQFTRVQEGTNNWIATNLV